MEKRKKVTISWSGGKDSAFALFRVLLAGEYEVVHLHTVFDSENKRVGLHGVHESLIEQQAKILDVPLEKLYLKKSDDHEAYRELMRSVFRKWKSDGVDAVIFGDIFLEDLRTFREELLSEAGLKAIFPLWGLATDLVAIDFLNAGFNTVLCSANASMISSQYAGLTFDEDFVRSLPAKVDPCGENGEFHTFVTDGPIFKAPVNIFLKETIERSYKYKINEAERVNEVEITFWFADLRLA